MKTLQEQVYDAHGKIKDLSTLVNYLLKKTHGAGLSEEEILETKSACKRLGI